VTDATEGTSRPTTPGNDRGTGRIVAGVDGSPPSVAALDWAARQAELTGAELEVLMTWDWPTSYGWTLPLPEDYDPAGDVHRVLDEVVAAVRADHPQVKISTLVAHGHPAVLLTEASEGADLLVVGSRGHGEFVGMLIGSVSEHCATHAHCPVLIHRDNG
jgi:nucleotide-binding universal stress UspA family protein